MLTIVQAMSGFAAIGFVFWTSTCIVRGFTAAMALRLSVRSLFSIATLRDRRHPLHEYEVGILQSVAGLTIACSLVFALEPFVPGLR